MSKSSTAISLVLLTAASAGFIGYKAVHSPPDPDFAANVDDNSGSDFGEDPAGLAPTNPSTQPYGGHSDPSNGYYNYHTNHYYSSGYAGSNSFSSSHSNDPHGSSSSHATGTSRGGFGSTGHSMSHAGS